MAASFDYQQPRIFLSMRKAQRTITYVWDGSDYLGDIS